jgi:hypothetical protein
MSAMGLWLRMRAAVSTADTVVAIERGRVRVVRGDVSPALVGDLADVLGGREGPDGLSLASGRGASLRVRIAGRIPKPLQQRIRNVWGAHAR